ncbi:MAG: AAA family ATPase, partial [Cocleimonas sp.]|nr:AAA family ATPase [Cocleimonas sp.]
MLKQLKIENFTVFSKADLQFSSGLNVMVGENGCGKSHLLKLLYAISSENTSQGKKPNAQKPTKEILEHRYVEKIGNVFHASLDQLVKQDMFGEVDIDYASGSTMTDIIQHTPLTINLNYTDKQLNTNLSYSDEIKDPLLLWSTTNVLTPPKKWDKVTP